jgi:hypothetical protein
MRPPRPTMTPATRDAPRFLPLSGLPAVAALLYDRPLTRRIAESSEVHHRLLDLPRRLITQFWPPWLTPPVHSRC